MKTRSGVMLKCICPYAFMHMSLWLSAYVLKFYCIHPYAYILAYGELLDLEQCEKCFYV